ncbi:MAG: alpha/beta hydrolase [Gemmatimonadaceae bacterium]
MMIRQAASDVDEARRECAKHRIRAAAIVAAALLAACAPLTSLPRTVAPLGVDTIWYVSARAREQGRDTRRLTDTLEYGLVRFTRNGMARELADSAKFDSATFARSLGAAARTEAPVMLYVHGYGTSLREAWVHTETVRANAETRAPWVVFAWPSNGSAVAWPKRGAVINRAYREDSAHAAASRPAFARVTRIVGGAVENNRLVVVAHSMGGQLVGEALALDTALRATLALAPLRAIAFVVPDVEAGRFADSLVPAARQSARRVVLYASSRDRLLALATFLDGHDRAGHVGDSALVRSGLETVDATHADFREGWAQRIFGMHHAIRRAVGTTFDLTHIVARELPAECRATMGIGERDARGVWRLNGGEPGRRVGTSGEGEAGSVRCPLPVVPYTLDR